MNKLREMLEKENKTLRDNHMKILSELGTDINNVLSYKLDDIGRKSGDYIQEIELKQKDAQGRFNSYMGRKKVIDIMIYANLGLTPILLLLLLLGK